MSSAARRIVPSPPSTMTSSMQVGSISSNRLTAPFSSGDERVHVVPVLGGDHRHRAGGEQLRADLARRLEGGLPAGVGDHEEVPCVVHAFAPPCHFVHPTHPFCRIRTARALRCTRYSWLPWLPAIGEDRTPAVPSPRSKAAQSTFATASERSAGVAHHAFAHAAAAHLELRLHEQHEVGVVGRGRARARAARS